jgi:hypothetical protein
MDTFNVGRETKHCRSRRRYSAARFSPVSVPLPLKHNSATGCRPTNEGTVPLSWR